MKLCCSTPSGLNLTWALHRVLCVIRDQAEQLTPLDNHTRTASPHPASISFGVDRLPQFGHSESRFSLSYLLVFFGTPQ
jgi:hypothetical protein